jgi:hypothetical protein
MFRFIFKCNLFSLNFSSLVQTIWKWLPLEFKIWKKMHNHKTHSDLETSFPLPYLELGAILKPFEFGG